MAKLAEEQTPEQVQLGRIDDIRAKMKEYGMDVDAADKIVQGAIQKYDKAIKSAEQLLKELAYTLDVAEEIGADQVAKEARNRMGEVACRHLNVREENCRLKIISDNETRQNAIQAFVEMGGRPPQEVIRALDNAQRTQKGGVVLRPLKRLLRMYKEL